MKHHSHSGRYRLINHLMYATFLGVFCDHASASSYDEVIAYKGVMYSAAAYCSYADIDKWDCGEPCTSTQGIIKGSVVRSV